MALASAGNNVHVWFLQSDQTRNSSGNYTVDLAVGPAVDLAIGPAVGPAVDTAADAAAASAAVSAVGPSHCCNNVRVSFLVGWVVQPSPDALW